MVSHRTINFLPLKRTSAFSHVQEEVCLFYPHRQHTSDSGTYHYLQAKMLNPRGYLQIYNEFRQE